MVPRRNNQVINIQNPGNARRIENFNYSENFNRIIELTTDNYQKRKCNMLYLLTINELVTYSTKEKVKKLRKKDIRDDISEYTEDQFDNLFSSEINTTKDQEKFKNFKNKFKNNKRKTKRQTNKCNYCGKRGHFFFQCIK